jgi:hypothetical protein
MAVIFDSKSEALEDMLSKLDAEDIDKLNNSIKQKTVSETLNLDMKTLNHVYSTDKDI